MKSILVKIVLPIILLTSIGYAIARWTSSPHDAANQAFVGVELHFYQAHQSSSKLGQLIPYSLDTDPAHDVESVQQYGYIPLRRNWWGGWQRGSRVACSRSAFPLGALTIYPHLVWNAYGYDHMETNSVICGSTSSKNTSAIEAVWNDGRVTRHKVADPFFVFSRMGRHGLCKMRIIHSDGEQISYESTSFRAFETRGTETNLLGCDQSKAHEK